jgi:Holliday junction resolvasome RuvABC endonuclease subunit
LAVGAVIRAAWQPPRFEDFPQGAEVIAFDPSLASTGWAWLRVAQDQIMVLGKGTIRSVTSKTGYEGTYERAHCIASALPGILMTIPFSIDDQPSRVYIAWEAPAVGGGHRTESSLIVGYLVWEAARQRPWGIVNHGGAVPVQANHVSKVLTDNPKHDKKEIAAAVARYIPESASRDFNEHIRDAVAVGLTRLLDIAAAIIK